MFKPFEQCQKDLPLEPYGTVIFCGKTGTGKSSLVAAIMELAKKPPNNYKFDSSDPTPIGPLTAGINTDTISSHEVGNIFVYDFAGHKEYYNSHATILKNLMLSTPAVFALHSKMTDDLGTIKCDLYYWFNFIKNVSLQLLNSKPSSIIVIGSRLDEMTDGYEKFSKVVADKANQTQEYGGFLPMECKFLKLFQYLGIIAPLSTTKTLNRYVMPAVLPSCQVTEEDSSVFTMSCDSSPIIFETKVIPQV